VSITSQCAAQRHDGTRLPRRIPGPRLRPLWMLGIVGLGAAAVSYENIRFREGTVVFDFVKAIDEAAGVSRDRSEAGASRYVQSGRDQRIRPPHAGEAENQRVGLIRFRGRAGVQRINALTDEIQGQLLESFGITALAKFKTRPAGPASWISHSSPFRSCRTRIEFHAVACLLPRFTLSSISLWSSKIALP